MGIDVLLNVNHLQRLLQGLWATVEIASLSVVISYVLGTLMGILRVQAGKWINMLLRLYLESFRIIPVLVWLYLLYYFLPANFGIDLNSFWVALIVFSLWGSAEMSDIVRGALVSLPKHQFESGLAVGLNQRQLFRYVLLPQVVQRVTPGAVNLTVRMIMTTSLLFVLGVVELIKVGQQIIESAYLQNPMVSVWIYGVILLMYFALCFPLSKLADHLAQSKDA
ncbi:amino acid ABC transporter permease [Stenoxybacter acetivorans]|uniref:amino acid ABC transporter permease n=1 Tax=Stenoxybacter acetivorans TaxID=422441 RepID=UPI003CCBECC4